MNCPNCGRTLGCSCMLVTAKDGTRCCKACVHSVNEKFRQVYHQQKIEEKQINKNRRNVIV